MKIIPTISVLFFCTTIIIAHFISPADYDWKVNTISEFGSQQYNFKWVMQVGFIGFGILLSYGYIVEMLKNNRLDIKYLMLILYGVSILITGFFCTKPFRPTETYNVMESNIHSLFAQIAGICLSISILLHFISAQAIGLKAIHFSYFLFVILISLAFGLNPNIQGIIQRILYLGSFSWIIFFSGSTKWLTPH